MLVTKVGNLVGAQNQTFWGNLSHSKKSGDRGKIIVKTDTVKGSNKSIKMTIRVSRLVSKKNCFWFEANNPFLVINRCHSMDADESIDKVRVYKTDYKTETIEPLWYIQEIKVQNLCNSNEHLPLVFEVWSFNQDGTHSKYGSFQTTLSGIIGLQRRGFDLIDDKGNKAGFLEFKQFLVIEKPSMMDFLRSGWIISMCAAIDFTASNGELSNPMSLHYIDPNNLNKMNSYEEAILRVGTILELYDHDKMFPVFGFGGIPRFMGISDISHCFHLNGAENPTVHGVQGILQAYRNAMYGGIGLYGPTNFSPCLQAVIAYSKSNLHKLDYTIMVYVTDGAITDMSETIDWIVEASYLPMSIIIIGVGDADFSKMEKLDCDDGYLRNSAGQKASRDIVQFVEFRNYKSDLSILAEEVLREVPNQLVSYMIANNIQPAPVDHIAVDAIAID